MESIQIHDKHFVPFINRDKISRYVEFMAKQIADDIGPDEVPIFIGILNGSFMFAADFVRNYPNLNYHFQHLILDFFYSVILSAVNFVNL